MNPTTVTLIIALAGFILSIFTANWLALRHTDKLVEQLDKRVVEQGRAFDIRLAEMEKRFDAKLETLAVEMRHISEGLKRIERQLDAVLKPSFPKG